MLKILVVLTLAYAASGDVDLFKSTPTIVKSYAIEAGYRESPDADEEHKIEKMENPWYKTKEENPQFGYSVALAGPISSAQTVLVSAPGNPSFAFSDPGFVEYQNLKTQPARVPDDYGKSVLILSPSGENSQAHTMYGSSVTVVPTPVNTWIGSGFQYQNRFDVYNGAPEGALCKKSDLYEDETRSFDNFGYVYVRDLNYVGTLQTNNPVAPQMEITEACFKGANYYDIESGEQQGFAQANRNLLGFSGHLSKDGLYLLSGAPMFRQQAGYVSINFRNNREEEKFEAYQTDANLKMYYLCEEDELKKYKGYSSGSGEKKAGFSSIICDVDLTYGYSLTSLKLGSETYLATGGPRASGLHGQVKIFKPLDVGSKFLDESFKFLKTLIGSRFNAGFGTTILGADLDGDGMDELLVGEPYRTDLTSNTYNSGGVSVYAYDADAKQFMFKYDLKSPKASESNMFGFKVASLGDADADGGEDILVTALTEDSKGKVYLFSGRSLYSIMNSEGTKSQPTILQEFENTGTGLFGFSIGETRSDLDENGFYDLIIGDPAKNNQKAYVYYANTIIRLLQPDGIQSKLIKDKRQIDASCPVDAISEDFNFCSPLEVVLENRGVYRRPSPEKDEELVPWTFTQDFDIDVSLEKEPDQQLFKIYGNTQTVTFSGTKKSTVTFYVYGQIPTIYGATIHLKGLTALSAGSTIKLDKTFEGETLLTPETFKDIDVSVSPLADVTLKATPQKATVILGNPQETLQIGAIVATRSGKDEHLVNGLLKLNLGTLSVGFSSATSNPSGIATCRKDSGAFVTCKFNKDKAFSRAEIKITLTVSDWVKGDVTQEQFVFGHELTWGNRYSDEVLTDSTKVQIVYHSVLDVIATDGSVAEGTPYRKEGNEIDYSINVMNLGISSIQHLRLDIYVPFDVSKFVILETHQFQHPMEYEGKKCTFDQCTKYTREFDRLGGNKSESVVVKVKFIDRGFWKKLVKNKQDFSFKVDYKVLKAARYGNLEKENYFPGNPEGTLTVSTRVTREKAPFPWWIVVVTLLVSVAIVIIVIIVLYKTNFFKKKDPNKLNEDDIDDDEFEDEDKEMTKKKYTSSA